MPVRRGIENVIWTTTRRYQSTASRPNASNAFISFQNDENLTRPPSRPNYLPQDQLLLAGRRIAVKDNICTTDLPTTCASGILKHFRSPYDATVVAKLRQHGAIIYGKTNMDEFGMGSHSIHSYFGPVINSQKPEPGIDADISAGGSSGGSAVAVAEGDCWAALGTDTGGSVRLPAAYTGVFGFKPSYGLISRWGVVAYANSLDTVGILATDVPKIKLLFAATSEYDPKDPTSQPLSIRKRIRDTANGRSMRIGVPIEYNVTELDPIVRNAWTQALHNCQKAGHIIVPVSLPTTKKALPAYYILAPAEASSNLAKYDGVRYGSRSDSADGADGLLFSRTRGEGFGEEVKRRILLGSYTLSAEAIDNYFIQAQKVRRVVQKEFDRVFTCPNPLYEPESSVEGYSKGVDFLLCPTAPTLAPSLQEVQEQSPVQSYTNDVFTVPASLAGLPAISVPWNVPSSLGRHVRVGIQIVGQFGCDGSVLQMAEQLEALSNP